MGRTSAALFAKQGATLFISDVIPDAPEEAAAPIRETCDAVVGTHVANITEPRSVAALVDEAGAFLGGDVNSGWPAAGGAPFFQRDHQRRRRGGGGADPCTLRRASRWVRQAGPPSRVPSKDRCMSLQRKLEDLWQYSSR